MRRVWFAAISVIVVAVALVGVLRVPAIGDAAVAAARWLHDGGVLGALAFWAAFVVGSLALAPDAIFSVAAGYAYGVGAGFAIGLVGTILSALATFALARGWLRGFAARHFRDDRRATALDQAVREHGAIVVSLVRVAPLLPFAAANYLFTMTAITFRGYLVGTAIGMLPWTFAYAYIGSSAPAALALLHGRGPKTLPLVGIAIAFGAAIALGLLARRELRRRLPKP